MTCVLSEGEGCCGALSLHTGKEPMRRPSQANIDAWRTQQRRAPLEAIIVNASGCGTTVKDYAHLFAHDPAYAARKRNMSPRLPGTSRNSWRSRDSKRQWAGATSALPIIPPVPCSTAKEFTSSRAELLRNAGFTVLDIPEGHICCGSAGTYNILQSELASELRERKLASIERVKPDCVASGNIGCITQLSGGPVPVVHTVELLDWAYGGPCPEALSTSKSASGRFRARRKTAGDAYEAA